MRVFSLVRITKFNTHFVAQSLSTVRFLCTMPVKFAFSSMIPSVNFVVSASAHFSRLFPNILMHYDSSTTTAWQLNLSYFKVLQQKQPYLQVEGMISLSLSKASASFKILTIFSVPTDCIFVLTWAQQSHRACLCRQPHCNHGEVYNNQHYSWW